MVLLTSVQNEDMFFHCWANESRGIGVITVPAENGVLEGDGE